MIICHCNVITCRDIRKANGTRKCPRIITVPIEPQPHGIQVLRAAGQNQTVDTRYAGSEVFQQPGADVFQALITLRDNLRDNLNGRLGWSVGRLA